MSALQKIQGIKISNGQLQWYTFSQNSITNAHSELGMQIQDENQRVKLRTLFKKQFWSPTLNYECSTNCFLHASRNILRRAALSQGV
jgi:hypothetical protein